MSSISSRKTLACRLIVSAVLAFAVAACATDRLDAAAPSGVSLAGDWKLNPYLSDDPDKLGPEPEDAPQPAPGSHRGHGGSGRGGGGLPGGTGLPPIGSPDGPGNYEFGPTAREAEPTAGGLLRVALTTSGADDSTQSPPSATPSTPSGPQGSRGANINRLLRAPVSMSITQNEGTLTVKANMPDGTRTTDEYAAGTKRDLPYGPDETAAQTAGWRGPVFVVITTAKKAGSREDDFALDDDGRLIMTTQAHGGRLGKVEIKRVYDRVRGR